MSALRHDSIIDAGDPDYALVEGEAERVAKEAVRQIFKPFSTFLYNHYFQGKNVEKFAT